MQGTTIHGNDLRLSVLRALRVSVVNLMVSRNSPRNHREHGENSNQDTTQFMPASLDSSVGNNNPRVQIVSFHIIGADRD